MQYFSDCYYHNNSTGTPEEAATYGGYYTQEQLKEIIVYAKIRNITIIPEIEMPDHVASVMAAYPELSCKRTPQLSMTGETIPISLPISVQAMKMFLFFCKTF